MSKSEYPETGQNWCLKSNPQKVAVIVDAYIDKQCFSGGYVVISAPWLVSPESGKCMDTFLKQYRKAS